jgi:hypothetical protein
MRIYRVYGVEGTRKSSIINIIILFIFILLPKPRFGNCNLGRPFYEAQDLLDLRLSLISLERSSPLRSVCKDHGLGRVWTPRFFDNGR